MHEEQLILLRFPAHANRLKLVRSAVREATLMCGGDADTTRDVVLAVDEACQNVIRHAYEGNGGGEVELEILRGGNGIVFRLRDFAPPVDAGVLQPRLPDEAALGGRGLHFIHTIMDRVERAAPHEGPGNLLLMSKRLDGNETHESQHQP